MLFRHTKLTTLLAHFLGALQVQWYDSAVWSILSVDGIWWIWVIVVGHQIGKYQFVLCSSWISLKSKLSKQQKMVLHLRGTFNCYLIFLVISCGYYILSFEIVVDVVLLSRLKFYSWKTILWFSCCIELSTTWMVAEGQSNNMLINSFHPLPLERTITTYPRWWSMRGWNLMSRD